MEKPNGVASLAKINKTKAKALPLDFAALRSG
jgi:hypothetical protein